MSTIRNSIFGDKWGQRIANAGLAIAKLAGYEAGQPTIERKQQNRYNTNPNSLSAQIERVMAAFNAEWLAKNSPFAIGYLRQRINYCTPQGWMPDTGDPILNQEVKAYCEDQWRDMGINCSMFEAFARVSNVELPARGDSCLVWLRDESRLRLMEIAADQIGEQYVFRTPMGNALPDLTYFAGMYFDRFGVRRAFQFYERGWNQVYVRIPQPFPSSDVLYFSDNLFRAIRGITIFHGTINSLTKSDQLFDFGLAAAQKQAKTGVVVRNAMAAPLDLSYDTRQDVDGNTIFIERNYDGAVTEYQYNEDSYNIIKTEAPGDALVEGCRYADERSCQSLGMPYAWLVTGRFDGGTGYRGDVNKASKEIGRICKLIEAPFRKIAYVTIMDGVDRGVFKGTALTKRLTDGNVQFPTEPVVDAFRETKDDIVSNRAGIESRQRILGRYREDWPTILRENTQEAIDISKSVQDANKRLKDAGYVGDITRADIAQDSDNPQQEAIGQEVETGKVAVTPTGGVQDKSQSSNPAPARLSAYIGDVSASDLPQETQEDIARLLGTNGSTPNLRFVKYGMVANELESMADPHNLASAQRNIRYATNGNCAEEVHANEDKHILVNNGRIVDGHHYLAKALKGRVTKSLPVIDLTPARFQLAK